MVIVVMLRQVRVEGLSPISEEVSNRS